MPPVEGVPPAAGAPPKDGTPPTPRVSCSRLVRPPQATKSEIETTKYRKVFSKASWSVRHCRSASKRVCGNNSPSEYSCRGNTSGTRCYRATTARGERVYCASAVNALVASLSKHTWLGNYVAPIRGSPGLGIPHRAAASLKSPNLSTTSLAASQAPPTATYGFPSPKTHQSNVQPACSRVDADVSDYEVGFLRTDSGAGYMQVRLSCTNSGAQ